jgi:hypothetical protein
MPIGDYDRSRVEESAGTAFVTPTVIRERYRKQGLLPKLLGTLDDTLVRRGYSFVERLARIETGYADTLVKAYGERVVEREDFFFDGKPLRSLRIRL